MNDQQKLIFLHCILAMAWADGSFAMVERDYLNNLITGIGADASVTAKVQAWLDHAPPAPNWEQLTADLDLGELILRKALELSMLDMSVSMREMSFLQQLADQLGFEDIAFFKLQQEVEQDLAKRLSNPS